MRCPQCDSKECGEYRCRFSDITHALFRENNYANAMVKRDQAPRWEREMRQGNPDTKPGYL